MFDMLLFLWHHLYSRIDCHSDMDIALESGASFRRCSPEHGALGRTVMVQVLVL